MIIIKIIIIITTINTIIIVFKDPLAGSDAEQRAIRVKADTIYAGVAYTKALLASKQCKGGGVVNEHIAAVVACGQMPAPRVYVKDDSLMGRE